MKILVSPGFGAGWSTWAEGESAKFALTYQPFIEWLEAHPGEYIPEDKGHPLVAQFLSDLKDATGEEYFYIGGIDDLVVQEVDGPFVVEDYDGSESVTTPGGVNWYTPEDFA